MEAEKTINSLVDFISIITKQEDPSLKKSIDEDGLIGSVEALSEYNQILKRYYSGEQLELSLPFFLQNTISIYNFLWNMENHRIDRSEPKRYYYRGCSNLSHKLAPGIYRANAKEENFFFKEMQVRCSMQLTQDLLLDKLVYLQHYGCPTRLLDITTNPLVALYFACEDDNSKDGVVYCFLVREKDILYPNSDRAQMLSHLCEFHEQEQEQIMALSMLYEGLKKFKQNSNSKYTPAIIERLYHSIKRETAAFEREMRPFDLLRPAFIQVSKSNPRITKQDGAFILSGLAVDEVDCDNRIKKHVFQRIIVPAVNKKSILKDLEQIGICEATLFPEADRIASYLKQ